MAMVISSLNVRAAVSTSTSSSSTATTRTATRACCKTSAGDTNRWLCSRRAAILISGGACIFGAAFSAGITPAEAEAEEEEEPKLKVLDSGLGFYDVRVGDGKPVVNGSFVKVNYTGKFADGTEFENTYRFPFKPLSFRLGYREVIDGWDLGLLGGDGDGDGIPPMRIGGKRILQVPPSMAFGEEGVGCRKGKPLLTLIGSILHPEKDAASGAEKANQAPKCFVPPDATLFFDVELLDAFELPKDPSEARKFRR